MLPHDVLMAAKVAMLERLVKDILIEQFNAAHDPLATVKRYAEMRLQLPPGAQYDPELDLARIEIWQQFLNDVVAGVQQSQGKHTR